MSTPDKVPTKGFTQMKTTPAAVLGTVALAVFALTACSPEGAARRSVAQSVAPAGEMRGIQAGLAASDALFMPAPMAKRIAAPENEKYSDTPINTIKSVATEPVSTFSIDVDTAA